MTLLMNQMEMLLKCSSASIVPQKHSSYASTTYNTQQRTRPVGRVDWDGICTADPFTYTHCWLHMAVLQPEGAEYPYTPKGSTNELHKTLMWKDDKKNKVQKIKKEVSLYLTTRDHTKESLYMESWWMTAVVIKTDDIWPEVIWTGIFHL